MSGSAPHIRPVLKWAGGKFRLLHRILPLLGAGRRLVEPFVGSGAVFLNSRFDAYLLCDLNADLIGFYTALVEGGAGFIEECRGYFADGNDPDLFYERRDAFNRLPPGRMRAALFLYFNRHGYNGLIRYNAKGRFNVPFGRYAAPRFPEAEMRAFADKARRVAVEFRTADFREAFSSVSSGDTVYCDPPYVPLSGTARFTAYAGNSFGAAEQRALAELALKAAGEGARVAVSNHDTPATRGLYAAASAIHAFPVRRLISCNGGKRDAVEELLAVYR